MAITITYKGKEFQSVILPDDSEPYHGPKLTFPIYDNKGHRILCEGEAVIFYSHERQAVEVLFWGEPFPLPLGEVPAGQTRTGEELELGDTVESIAHSSVIFQSDK